MAMLDFLKGAVNTVGNGIVSAGNNLASNLGWNWAGSGQPQQDPTNVSYSSTQYPGVGDTPPMTTSDGVNPTDIGQTPAQQAATAAATSGSTGGGSSSTGLDTKSLNALLSSGQAQMSSLLSGGQLAQSQAAQQQQSVTAAAAAQIAQAQKLRDATLNSANQREGFLNDQYAQNMQLGNQSYDASTQTANEKAQLSLQDINDALNQTLPSLDRNKSNVIDSTETARNSTEDQLRRQFEGRNAVDSTFYGKAAAEATAGLYKQRNDQVFQIDQAITTAHTQAASQQRAVKTDLNAVLRDLSIKKNEQMAQLQQAYSQGKLSLNDVKQAAQLSLDSFASETEIQKIGQLQQISFNLDNYMQGLQEKQAAVRQQLAASGATGVDYSANMNDANAFMQQLAAAKR